MPRYQDQLTGEEPERVLIGGDNLLTNQEAVFIETILETTEYHRILHPWAKKLGSING